MPKKVDKSPYRIFEGEIPRKGSFGFGICPGHSARLDIGVRCLKSDLQAIQDWEPTIIVSLLTKPEFAILGVPDFEKRVRETGIKWQHFPIEDGGVPRVHEMNFFWQMIKSIVKEIITGKKVFIHCRGGIGRSGIVICQSLKQIGYGPKQSLSLARTWRHGAVENKVQENFVLNISGQICP